MVSTRHRSIRSMSWHDVSTNSSNSSEMFLKRWKISRKRSLGLVGWTKAIRIESQWRTESGTETAWCRAAARVATRGGS